ncbi:MAG: restriction endonuclease subunit S [Fusobacteriaceae bacterium]
MNKIPKLRFPEFSGEWEENSLESICDKIKEKNKGNLIKTVFSNSAKYGIVLQDDFFDREITTEANQDNYYVVQPYSFVYNPRISQTAPVGPVSVNKTGLTGIVSPLYTVFHLKNSSNVSKEYLEKYFVADKWHNYLKSVANTGARHDRMNITDSQLFKLPIFSPSLPEQEEIASFLSSVDSKIEKLERKKELWEQYKKGMMQKIFSQELRFKDENGEDYPEWEENLIGDIFQISAGGDIKSENTSALKTEDFKYPIYANSDKNKGLFGYSNIYKQKGNCVTVTGRGNLGVAVARYTNFYPIVRLLVLRPKQNQNIKFFEEAINNIEFLVESTGVPQLTGPQISSYLLSYPSLPEQTQIADFLSSLDSKIEIVEKEILGMKEFKKGLLQKMFV